MTSFVKNLNKIGLYVICLFMIDSVIRMTFSAYLLPETLFLSLISGFSLIYLICSFLDNREIIKDKRMILIFIFFFVTLLSTIYNGNSLITVQNSIYYHIIWFFLIYFYFANMHLNNLLYKKLNIILYVILIVLTIFSLITISLYIFETILKIDLPFSSWSGQVEMNNRVVGITGNAAATGVLAYMSLMICFYFLSLTKEKFNRFILLANAILNLSVLLIADSRGALIALFILLLFVGLRYYSKLSFQSKLIKPIIIIVFSISILFTGYRVLGLRRFANIWTYSNGNIETILEIITSERYSLWKDTIEMIEEKPILGFGIDHFTENAQLLLSKNSTIIKQGLKGPHNVLLEAGYATGMVGLLLAISIFILIFKDCYKNYILKKNLNSIIVISMIFGMIVISMFDFGIFFRGTFMSPLFWLMAGFIVAENKYLESIKEEGN